MIDLSKPWIKEAMFWERINGKVRCRLCHRYCIISEGEYGACGVRYNQGGKLYTLVYGLLTAANVDPIEKKPLYHFHPGSLVFSISTSGCNFFCKFCLNWSISQARKDEIFGEYIEPSRIVEMALRRGSDGISYTYNEPTVFFELMYDTAKLARKNGLFNTMVTNGYMSIEAAKEISKYMDAATIDLKVSGNREFYRKFMSVPDPDPIFDTILELKRGGVFIEITNLIIPGADEDLKDLRRLVRWIVNELSDEVPLHLLRFYPNYLMTDVEPTPLSLLEKCAKVAKEEGLKHVYLGNVPGHPLEHTYCPKCGELVIERYGFEVISYKLSEDGKCPKCGYRLNIVGKYKRRRLFWLL